MSKLLNHFDRVVVISLPPRTDRRERLLANLTECGLAQENDITWFDAVDGSQAEIPDWWKSGPGAWGCRFSQLEVIEQAQRDGLENVLIIEDDAVFHPRAGEWLDSTMPLLPDDWGQFFLGGQHLAPPIKTDEPKIVKGRSITRTHAYAVHRRAYQVITDHVRDDEEYRKHPGMHIDHHMGACQTHGYWTAYAPSWWMAGQDEGRSNIAQTEFERRWWQEGNHYWKLPFIAVSDSETHEDFLCLNKTPAPETNAEICIWLRHTAQHAWLEGKLPAYRASTLDQELVSKLWPGGIRTSQTESQLAELVDYPSNNLFPHPFTSKPKQPNLLTK